MKIIMTVNHGDVFHEVARGETFEVCLAYLSATHLYRGYGPKLSEMKPLKDNGKMSYGWADYNFYNDEQIAELIK